MIRLYISYDHRDDNQVLPYVKGLPALGYDVLVTENYPVYGEERLLEDIKKAIRESDCVLLFFTKNSAISDGLLNEIWNTAGAKKLILPVIWPNVVPPEVLDILSGHAISLKQGNVEQGLSMIDATLQSLLSSRDIERNISGDHPLLMTGSRFAKQFNGYLTALGPKTYFGKWVYEGPTDIAYGTPVGPWDTEGFLFSKNDYKFVLRSVAREGSNYLVVESVNLTGQLANLALDNPQKFSNNAGTITIYERFDMTVGYGRRARSEVEAAFRQAGMKGQVITAFSEYGINWEQILVDILTWAEFREEAKEILLKVTDVSHEPPVQLWFLKLTNANWQPEQLGTNVESHFYGDYPTGMPRPEYERYKKIQKGDLGIAFDSTDEQAFVFLFSVTDPLKTDGNDRNLFSFRITQLRYRYNFTAWDFAELIRLSETFKAGGESIFELSEPFYFQIVDLFDRAEEFNSPTEPTVKELFNQPSLSQVFSDSPSRSIEDSLGFMKDIEALASVMVYKEVTPPLAIGLFGKWGSGKSFFMNKLQQRIEELAVDQRGVFCKKVLQINFNSWHYSDSNLWASLVTKIFEELEKYGKDKPDELKDLFQHLSSTKEMVSETKNEKSAVERDLVLLQEEKVIFERQANVEVEQLRNLSPNIILAELWANTSAQAELEKLKREYSFLKVAELDDIEQQVNELDGFFDRVISAAKIIPTLFSAKRVIIATLIFVVIMGSLYYLSNISNAVQVLFTKFRPALYTFSVALAGLIQFLKPAMSIIGKVHDHLKSLQGTIRKLRIKADEEFIGKRKEINDRITGNQTETAKLDAQIETLQLRQQKLVEDINDITSGRKVIRFIESRVSDERYHKSLGIISWVRRDFEQLDFLLGQQSGARQTDYKDMEAVPLNFELERIILYIDDLDRCHEKIVINVLEAINLLLAFPLFVVVVGVDPRWMHNALHQKYPHLQNGLSGTSKMHGLSAEELESSATSSDYLEKIFQIPFALKPMTQSSKASLIGAQLKIKEAVLPESVIPIILRTDPSALDLENFQVGSINSTENILPEELSDEAAASESVSHKPEQTSVVADVKRLLISMEEEDFMKGLAFLIGDSPRTIKRFINIYRIVRTHEGFRVFHNEELSCFYAAMIILAVMTGRPKLLPGFCTFIETTGPEASFLLTLSGSSLIAAGLADSLEDLINLPAEVDAQLTPGLTGLRIGMFKENLELVTRFTFNRSY